jgi:hypothetical protein
MRSSPEKSQGSIVVFYRIRLVLESTTCFLNHSGLTRSNMYIGCLRDVAGWGAVECRKNQLFASAGAAGFSTGVAAGVTAG